MAKLSYHCRFCGVEKISPRPIKFCSRECRRKYGEANIRKLTCKCGKEFTDAASGHRKYCSVKCSRKYMPKNFGVFSNTYYGTSTWKEEL